ncbi:hypothetical protein, partial [Achromobacter mucicolens]|uniref:hypothetical protein n=1 Tax=Achromobacter mucicolens TaxID=1389922 RepID=UPI001C2EB3B6
SVLLVSAFNFGELRFCVVAFVAAEKRDYEEVFIACQASFAFCFTQLHRLLAATSSGLARTFALP